LLPHQQPKEIVMSQNPYDATGQTAGSTDPAIGATGEIMDVEPVLSSTYDDGFTTPASSVSSSVPSSSSSSSGGTKETAKEQASKVGSEAVQGGQQVAATAAEQAKSVASDAGDQAKNLLSQARSQFADQASTQQSNLASWLKSMADELHTMAQSAQDRSSEGQSGQSGAGQGVATKFASQASGQVNDAATWLESHEPKDLIDQATRFARQRPGTFLAIAALSGLLAGRVTRGLTGGSSSSEADTQTTGAMGVSGAPTYTTGSGVGLAEPYEGTGVGTSDLYSTGVADQYDTPVSSTSADVYATPVSDTDAVLDDGITSSAPYEADRR